MAIALADDSLCARVKMEVGQELALERQAFDAHMRIHNGLDLIALENVGVEVSFLDQDGKVVRASSNADDTSVSFFIKLNSLENISRVDGLGVVSPKTSADVHWLIIPAPGASNGVEAGSLYYVGATLRYTLGGESHSTTVTPDHIFVKPMPEMVLDYFLPSTVTGDDPFTTEVEPPVPFSLGVRVTNHGSGTARDVTIDSAQPRIVENVQGLPIAFAITSSEVNGSPASRSLLVDLGDIPPEAAASARWTMTCGLSGRFVELKADFSHSNELGGELTSLIDSIQTHLLVQDVLVDLAGRDAVRDFLARDGDVLRVYESEGVDTAVLDQSGLSSLQSLGQTGALATYSLSTPPAGGFSWIQLPDPGAGKKVLKEVLRSDGKRIKPENCRLTSTRTGPGSVQHTLNLFDVNSTGSYRVVLDDPGFESRPPLLQAIPDQQGVEGQELTFSVTASDPDGTIPVLSATTLPATAQFADGGDGHGLFSWTPLPGQAGRYDLIFWASDGALKSSQRAALTICSAGDTDCDGMADAWELAHFGSLARDGKGDLDGDGISDCDEFWRNTDPTRSNAPATPVILSPQDGSEVRLFSPEITVRNATEPSPLEPIHDIFELYSEPAMVNFVARATGLLGTGGTTTWSVPETLRENAWYFFRVRATDGRNSSAWAYGSFFVNTENEAPGELHPASPAHGAQTASRTPVLAVTNSTDPDGDVLIYAFEVFSDRELSSLMASESSIPEGLTGTTSWTVPTLLSNHRSYFWRATATDEHGKASQSPLATFTVNLGNQPPTEPVIVFPASGAEVSTHDVELVLGNSTDPDGDPLTYTFELDRAATFDSPSLSTSGALPEGAATTRWKVSGLAENTEYHFRARADDGTAQSSWAAGSFFVSSENEPPSTPTIKNPGPGSWVRTLTPVLELNPSVDPDRDGIRYRFELAGDSSMGGILSRGESDTPAWTVPLELPDNTFYSFRGKALDEHGVESDWTPVSTFFVNNNGIDDPPEISLLEPSSDVTTNSPQLAIRWRDSDPDSNAEISLACFRDSIGADAVLIAAGLKEDPDGPWDCFLWDASAVPDGTYRLHATIADGISSSSCVSPGSVTFDRTPPSVQAAPRGGVYPTPQSVTLSADEPASIFFTLDGMEPNPSSPRYVAPIEIDATVTLRFMAVDAAGNSGGPALETYTMLPGATVSRFGVSAPSRVKTGLGFPLTLRALGRGGGLDQDFKGPVTLSSSGGALSPTVAEGFVGGIWKGSATLSGARGPVTITATLGTATGESRPILVQCDPPRPPVLQGPRDRARLLAEDLLFTWNASRGAVSYIMELAADRRFEEVLLAEDALAETACSLPPSLISSLEPGRPYFWRVRGDNGCGAGEFSRSWSFVYGGPSQGELAVISPAERDILRRGSTATIRWSHGGHPDRTLRLSFKAGSRGWNPIAAGIPASAQSFAWTVPPIRETHCLLLIEYEQGPAAPARSGPFTIR